MKTTIDLHLQNLARQAISKTLTDPNGPSAALVAIDPQTGEVLAMFGGSNYRKSQFNLAVQGERQPGSSFKPFVLATALNEGISPQTTFVSQPVQDPRRRPDLGRPQLRGLVPRRDLAPDRDDGVGQLGLRAADETRRAGGDRAHGERARDHEPAQELLRDRARSRGGQPARDGAGVLGVRERRAPDRRQGVREHTARDRVGARQQGPMLADNRPVARQDPAHGVGIPSNTAALVDELLATSSRRARAAPHSSPTAGRRRARPARPRTTATPGSSASRRTSSRRSGSATRTSSCR